MNSEFFLLLDYLPHQGQTGFTEEPSLPYYLPIAGGRIIGFIPFPRVLVLCEMQSVSSRIWTRVAVFISYDDNHYTPGTSRSWYTEIKNNFYEPNLFYWLGKCLKNKLWKNKYSKKLQWLQCFKSNSGIL